MKFIVLYVLVFYWCFVIAMAAKSVWMQLPIVAKIVLVIPALVGLFMDVFFNIFIATMIFGDLPKEWTFTKRLDRYELETGHPIENKVAIYICRCLNPFQVGNHCTK